MVIDQEDARFRRRPLWQIWSGGKWWGWRLNGRHFLFLDVTEHRVSRCPRNLVGARAPHMSNEKAVSSESQRTAVADRLPSCAFSVTGPSDPARRRSNTANRSPVGL